MAKERFNSVMFVNEKCEEGTNWAVFRQVQINRAFYSSHQWISWDKTKHRIFVPELRTGELRLTFNKIKPHILTLLSKMCKNRVQLEVLPDTNDIERIEVAKGGFKMLKYQWQQDNMDRLTRRLKFHMLVDGFPMLKVYVDRTKGYDVDVDDEMRAEMEEAGQQVPTKTGKICTEVVDQLSFKVDPNARAVEEIGWVLEETPTDIDDIEEEWGVKVAPETDISMTMNFDPLRSQEVNRKYKNHAMVKDFWEFPCPKYPKGRRIVIAGDKQLLLSDDPGESPYLFFPAIPIPGTAVAAGLVTDLTTPQKSYNIKKTAEARILEEMGNPLWMKPQGSVDDDELVNEIGGIVEFTPIAGYKPERVNGVEPGAGWQNAMERDEADMEDMSGAHEISQGSQPRGNNTLGGLQLQLEQDETKIALMVQSYEDGIKEWGEKVLRLVQKYFPEEQQLSIVGDSGDIEAFAFAGADLTGKEVVDVVPGSSMPTLKAVQDEKIMAMWGAGMFANPQTGQPDTRRVVRMLGESIASQYFDDTEQDENKALMENRTWQQTFKDPQKAQAVMQWHQAVQMQQQMMQQAVQRGIDPATLPPTDLQPPVKLPGVRDFYDHETHIQAHNRFRKSDEYDELPPQLQAIIDQHVAEHEQALMAPQMQQQQQMQAQQMQDAEAQQAGKQQEHQNRMEEAALKGKIALQQARMKGGGQ